MQCFGPTYFPWEAEHWGLDVVLIDDPPARKKAKLEKQMKVIEVELGRLKSEWNNMVATPPWNQSALIIVL